MNKVALSSSLRGKAAPKYFLVREPSPLEQIEEITMPWYVHFAHFFGAAFLANALPHLIAGVSGQPLQTPFASPPFKGLSPPTVNVAWALANLAFAYLLLVRVEALDLRSWPDVGVSFVGFGAMALQCSRSLARIRKQAVP
ncbi:hypothetical protein WMF45_00775 [Sorangium sp. So ce448]|uniref:hypothetical protein n=1 Tax=Sorangium sp. So ce448 TaxID=3133314 RepID=UPI003F6332AA